MKMPRVASFVALSLVAAVWTAGADPTGRQPEPTKASHSDTAFRASVERAVSQAPLPQASPRDSRIRRQSANGTSGGGGGGHMLMALIGTAISVGATVYVVKQMKKNSEPVPTP